MYKTFKLQGCFGLKLKYVVNSLTSLLMSSSSINLRWLTSTSTDWSWTLNSPHQTQDWSKLSAIQAGINSRHSTWVITSPGLKMQPARPPFSTSSSARLLLSRSIFKMPISHQIILLRFSLSCAKQAMWLLSEILTWCLQPTLIPMRHASIWPSSLILQTP